MKSYITEMELYDDDFPENRLAKLTLTDLDCVQVAMDDYHTVTSWQELSAEIEKCLVKMGAAS